MPQAWLLVVLAGARQLMCRGMWQWLLQQLAGCCHALVIAWSALAVFVEGLGCVRVWCFLGIIVLCVQGPWTEQKQGDGLKGVSESVGD